MKSREKTIKVPKRIRIMSANMMNKSERRTFIDGYVRSKLFNQMMSGKRARNEPMTDSTD